MKLNIKKVTDFFNKINFYPYEVNFNQVSFYCDSEKVTLKEDTFLDKIVAETVIHWPNKSTDDSNFTFNSDEEMFDWLKSYFKIKGFKNEKQ